MRDKAELCRLRNRAEGQGDGISRHDIHTWKAVTVVELKAYYGLLFLMEVMKFDRLEMYWVTSSDHLLVGSAFGEVMSRDHFMQIKSTIKIKNVGTVNDMLRVICEQKMEIL